MGFHFLTDSNFGCIVKMPLLPSHPSPSHRRGWGLGGPSRVRTHWWTILRPSQRGLEFCDHLIQPRFCFFQVADFSVKISSTRVSMASQYASSSSGGSGTATSCNSTARDSSCIHWSAYAWITARLRVVKAPRSSNANTSGNFAHRQRIAHSIRQSL